MAQTETLANHQRALLHPGLVGAGATLLIAAFVSDVLYWQTLLFQYDNFSGWLLAGGLALALLAAVAFVIDLAMGRVGRIAWLRFTALAVTGLLGIYNAFVHSRDAYTAVVPEGIILSSVVTVILLAVGLTGGWSLASRKILPISQGQDVRS